jgi:hypothetical protein
MILEKLVKISPMKWDDLVVDGIKSALTSWKKDQGLKSIALICTMLMCAGCAGMQSKPIPDGCEGSIIWNHQEVFTGARIMLRAANLVALEKDWYTKDQALAVLDEADKMLDEPALTNLTYVNWLLKKIKLVNGIAGSAVFIVSDEAVLLFSVDTVMHQCDRKGWKENHSKIRLDINLLSS